MNKYFYSHIIEIESLIIELDKLDLSTDEEIHLASLIDSNLHQAILDAVLSELSDKDKEIFLAHLSKNDHDKIWQHLNEKIESIEEKIKKVAEELKEQLHQDIEKAHGIEKASHD